MGEWSTPSTCTSACRAAGVLQYSLVRAPEDSQTSQPAPRLKPLALYNRAAQPRPQLARRRRPYDSWLRGVNQAISNPSAWFSAGLSQAQFVIAALEKWQFRAAMQGGQAARVEVLLTFEQSE